MSRLKGNIEEYINLQKERLVLNAADKTSDVVSAVSVRIAYIVCGLLAVTFLSISIAMGINSLTRNSYLGFLIVSILYMVISYLLYRNGEKWFGRLIASDMLEIFFKDEENEKR